MAFALESQEKPLTVSLLHNAKCRLNDKSSPQSIFYCNQEKIIFKVYLEERLTM
jgi:hypothetical protein